MYKLIYIFTWWLLSYFDQFKWYKWIKYNLFLIILDDQLSLHHTSCFISIIIIIVIVVWKWILKIFYTLTQNFKSSGTDRPTGILIQKGCELD